MTFAKSPKEANIIHEMCLVLAGSTMHFLSNTISRLFYSKTIHSLSLSRPILLMKELTQSHLRRLSKSQKRERSSC